MANFKFHLLPASPIKGEEFPFPRWEGVRGKVKLMNLAYSQNLFKHCCKSNTFTSSLKPPKESTPHPIKGEEIRSSPSLDGKGLGAR